MAAIALRNALPEDTSTIVELIRAMMTDMASYGGYPPATDHSAWEVLRRSWRDRRGRGRLWQGGVGEVPVVAGLTTDAARLWADGRAIATDREHSRGAHSDSAERHIGRSLTWAYKLPPTLRCKSRSPNSHANSASVSSIARTPKMLRSRLRRPVAPSLSLTASFV